MVKLELPSSGALHGDTSTMVDPHKIGNVMWSLDMSHRMAPLDLHGQLTNEDLESMHRLFKILMSTRKISWAIEFLVKVQWSNKSIILPYLEASLRSRSGARDMISRDEWWQFWNALN